jgi:hypothetical protein
MQVLPHGRTLLFPPLLLLLSVQEVSPCRGAPPEWRQVRIRGWLLLCGVRGETSTMRKMLCWLFGHLISRREFDDRHGTWNEVTKLYDWPAGYECQRCHRRVSIGRFV